MLTNIIFLFLFLLVSVLGYQIIFGDKIQNEIAYEGSSICGTKSDISTTSLRVGKTLFWQNCAMCHNKNMKDDLTGPALGGVINRWNNDTTSIRSYLNDSEYYHAKHATPRLKSLKEKFGSIPNCHKNEFTIVETKALLDYFEMRY